MNKKLKKAITLRNKALKHAKCSKCCWYIWFLTVLVYILGIVYLLLGLQKILNVPNLLVGTVNENAVTVADIASKVAKGVDNFFHKALDINVTIMTDLLDVSIEESAWADYLDKFRAETASMEPLE